MIESKVANCRDKLGSGAESDAPRDGAPARFANLSTHAALTVPTCVCHSEDVEGKRELPAFQTPGPSAKRNNAYDADAEQQQRVWLGRRYGVRVSVGFFRAFVFIPFRRTGEELAIGTNVKNGMWVSGELRSRKDEVTVGSGVDDCMGVGADRICHRRQSHAECS